MADVSQTQVEDALKTYIDPYLETDLVSAKAIKNIKIDGSKVSVDVVLGYPANGYLAELSSKLKEKVEALDGISEASFNISHKIDAHEAQKGVNSIPGVKNIIAIASGKGGVGKSTTAVNLALALSAEGATVGILDADIYGPSQPRMLGVHQQPESSDGKSLEPLNSYHIQSMSIGYLIDEETPMIWRGPMVTQALEQLLNDTNWEKLDYLVVDLPPGTSDASLTVMQSLPMSGIVLVSSPQDLAGMVVRKAANMARQMQTPILGLIENMSYFECPDTGKRYEIFGPSHAEETARQIGVPYLGRLPIDPEIARLCDAGRIEEYTSDPFASITHELTLRAPEARRTAF